MKGLLPLFLGIFGTLAFSWAGLIAIPNAQIGHLDPQMDEEGTDVYPAPKSGLAERGRHVYTANGCFYCHSQQVRADYAGSDIERKWGTRRSAPRDYLFDRPVLLGKMRMGPDLSNIGKRAPSDDANAPAPNATTAAPPPGVPTAVAPPAGAVAAAGSPPAGAPPPAGSAPAATPASGVSPATPPAGATTAASSPSPAAATAAQTVDASGANDAGVKSGPVLYSAAWHHQHLYDPRTLNGYSTMPSFRFLYEKRRISGERAADALPLTGPAAADEGWEIVPSYDAKALVAYLMSLDQSHELKEVKGNLPASAPAPGKAVK